MILPSKAISFYNDLEKCGLFMEMSDDIHDMNFRTSVILGETRLNVKRDKF